MTVIGPSKNGSPAESTSHPKPRKVLVNTARRLDNLPDVDEAVASGVIGFDRAAAIARLADRDDALDLLSEAAGHDIDGIRQLAAKRRRMTRLDEIQAFEERYVSIQPNLDETCWTLTGRLPGFAGRTVVEALETRGDEFPYGQGAAPSRTTRNADALWSISHDAVSGGDGATIDTSSPVLTVFVDATEAAASNGTTGVTLEAGPRVGPNAVEAILCTGFDRSHRQNHRRATPCVGTPHQDDPTTVATVRSCTGTETLHRCRLHVEVSPPDPSY